MESVYLWLAVHSYYTGKKMIMVYKTKSGKWITIYFHVIFQNSRDGVKPKFYVPKVHIARPSGSARKYIWDKIFIEKKILLGYFLLHYLMKLGKFGILVCKSS